ncbi:Tat (twin-arginine translocation) pathway signal sequence containing protein [Christiangramia fulva]|uniref:Tat (Twin-arginine translocation) pathway signal sequence containing protein n=1 Tax=Christiangramia fulva TaxID=2126553 RepID=A0A2R3Z9R3_9FLAO|nr:twin-arginine translocation signal domain-containing protein [Christiangramia fulva]AVR47035.1 Tat (twin-arginine translocation) pathway signal sequence containing protein [Christiangramia fulva]
MKTKQLNSRRDFLGTLALGAAMGSISPIMAGPIAQQLNFSGSTNLSDPEKWMDKIKGTHRAVFDGSTAYHSFPVIWNWAFYLTNNQTGVPDDDITAMTVLRHDAIPLALEDRIWEKYKLGEFFKVDDNITKKPSLRNTVYEPQDGDFPLPGIDGIKKLQDRGAMFCACDLALKVNSSFAAKKMNMDPKEAYNDWVSGVLPGIQVVPSGVWALGRAQQHDCAYIYAGG